SDGRYVAFSSYSGNLVPNDTNGASDVFVRDTAQQTTTRISVSSLGTQGTVDSVRPAMSGDGGTIVFQSNFQFEPFLSGLFANDRISCLPAWIINGPQSRTAQEGASVTLRVSADGNPPPTIRWLKNGLAVPNSNSPVLTFQLARPSDSGQYVAVATNGFGS